MRTFIAIEIGEEARRSLAAVLDDLRARIPGVRWTAPEHVHLTVRFLGEIAPADAVEAAAAAREAARGVPPFSLCFGRPRSFGGRAPRVLTLGVEGETGNLARLHARLEDALDRAGFGREHRRFTPHLTLGRPRSAPPPEAWSAIAFRGPTEWDVGSMTVFESTLTPRGPVYTPLAHVALAGEDNVPPRPKTET